MTRRWLLTAWPAPTRRSWSRPPALRRSPTVSWATRSTASAACWRTPAGVPGTPYVIPFNVNEMGNATPMQRWACYQVRWVTTPRGFAVSPIPAVGIEPTRAFASIGPVGTPARGTDPFGPPITSRISRQSNPTSNIQGMRSPERPPPPRAIVAIRFCNVVYRCTDSGYIDSK